MIQTPGSRQILFRIFVASGVILGVVLLLQTVGTYLYVSGNLVVDAALDDAERKAQSLQRSLRNIDGAEGRTKEEIDAVLSAALTDWQGRVGWLRVLDSTGAVLAEAGAAVGEENISPERVRAHLEGTHDRGYFELRIRDEGRFLATAIPLRLGFSQSDMTGGPVVDASTVFRGGSWLEISVSLDSVSASFTALRRNLIIGVSAAFALLGTVIAIAFLLPHYIRGRQLESQLELARGVQRHLLGMTSGRFGDADIAADCTPVSQLGGDFFDVFDLPGGQMGIMLGDVSGKGVSAAPLMAFIHGAAHATSWTASALDHERASGRLNDLIHSKTATDRFVTFFWGYFQRETSAFRYVNAGHCAPLLVRPAVEGDSIIRLEEGGPVLGAIAGVDYVQGKVPVRNGDVLVVYSDGIVEATNTLGEEFGDCRIIEAIERCRQKSAGQIRDAILGDLVKFRKRAVVHDDQTLVVVKFQLSSGSVRPDETVALPAFAG